MKFLAVAVMLTLLAFVSAKERPSLGGLREIVHRTSSEEITWYDDGSSTSEKMKEIIASRKASCSQKDCMLGKWAVLVKEQFDFKLEFFNRKGRTS